MKKVDFIGGYGGGGVKGGWTLLPPPPPPYLFKIIPLKGWREREGGFGHRENYSNNLFWTVISSYFSYSVKWADTYCNWRKLIIKTGGCIREDTHKKKGGFFSGRATKDLTPPP